MGLSAEERKQLKALQQKEQEPDAPSIGRSANFTIDLGDDNQVKRAIKYGILPADDDDDDGGGGDDDSEDDDTPRRRNYFKDK